MADRKECYILLLLAILLCLYTVSAQILTPTYFNVAYGKRITASATCGEGIPEPEKGERYCKLTGNTGDVFRPAEAEIINGQYCDQCNIYNPSKNHPIDYAIDGTEKWWQSPPISRGSMYNEVNVTIDLGQLYHVAYLIIKSANSPRPGQWILERSADYGETYSAWQYFAETASNCVSSFGMESLKEIRKDDDVICTDEYSNIVPLEDGEIVVSLVNGRPSANNFSYSEVLQDWTKATNIRLRLIRTNTLLGHLMAVAREDSTVTRRYFYSIKDISIGGRCFCNGHASACDTLDNAGQLQCTCEHNTCGPACDICCPGFVQKIWKPASLESSNECEPCNCFGHATECYYDDLIAEERRSIDIYGKFEGGGVCQNCQHNTQSINCNQCKGGYYRPEGRDLSSHNVCEKCHCDPFFSTGNCADITGVCECRPEYAGPGCSQCNEGYYGYPSCRPCDCNINGTQEKICQVSGGQCPCKPSYTGRNCDRCSLGYFNFPSCESCGCDGVGSRDTICESGTGQCPCHDVYSGRTCSQCKDGYYGYPACRDCNCNAIGTTDVICDKDVGTCLCEDNFEQPQCDRCAGGYYNYPTCQACYCGSGSTSDSCYDDGQCVCTPNFSGAKCDRCAAGYYRFPDCVSCECNYAGAFSISCDQSSGQCDCRSNFQGRMCEQCAESFYNYPTCEECNCHPGGVIDVPGQPLGGCGSATGGACLCKDNVQGRTCNECRATFWNLQISNPRGCELCECNPDGTIAGNGVCNIVSGQCHCKALVTNTQCTECVDGTYQMERGNTFGCRDCLCDVGGAIHLVCDKETGQCICRPRVTGPSCNEPTPVHYFPTLYQHMFEIESGTTPDGGGLRIGYDDSEFPNFSYLGYAVMSNIQPVVHVPITVDRSSIYRIVLRYVSPGDTTVRGKITLIPSGSGSEQESGIQFYNGNDPQLVIVDGGSNIMHFVLDPGQWIVRIEAPEGILLDYLVLLPLEYYEAPILQVRVNEPCVAGVSQELCNYYVFPKIDNFPTVRGVNGYYDNNGDPEQIQVYNDRDLLDDLGAPDLAMLDVSQPSLYFIIPIVDLIQYIFIVEYYGGGPGKQQATFDLWGLADVSSGNLNLYDCSYLCRSVVVDESGLPMVFDVDITDPTGQIVPTGSPFPLGISQIIAIPILHWSEDLITPALKCVKTATGECAPSSYPRPPGSIRIETGADGRLPPDIQDPSTSLMYLSIAEGYPTLTIDQDVQPLDGSWVFIVHYYQPHPTAVDVNFGIPGEFDGIGTFTGHYCPHVSGCHAVVTRPDGSPNFDLTGQGQGITFSLPPQSQGEIWIDYILAVPKSSYTPSILIEEPQDRAGDFIKECGQQSFYLNPEEVSEFCRESVYSLSVDYNNGAQSCDCDLQGSTKLQCNAFGGQCSCKANIIGRDCNRCRIGYYNFPYCRQCTCSAGVCNEVTGACICPANVIGNTCDRCAPNTYGYNPLVGCVACECEELGTVNADLSCSSSNGQCRCDSNIGGRRCDKCEAGYLSFPFCSPCDCNVEGTTPEICDQTTGQCLCRSNVEGDRCDQCRGGTFFLNPENDNGCISCFCFGASSDCRKYNRRRGKITMETESGVNTVDMMSNIGVTNVHEPYLQESTNLVNVYVQGMGVDPQTAIYWTLPNKYIGNKLTAYGGILEYTVQNNPLNGGSNQPMRRPDIMITGNNITIIYTHNIQPQPGQYLTVSIELTESNFQYSFSARQVQRDDFMMVLANIDSFMIRAQYLDTLQDAIIGDVTMEIARRDGTGEKAFDVERCTCPKQYTGLSCERCADSYYHGRSGAYLGTCIPCNCNNHADRCDPITGQCIDCRDGTTGIHCEECQIGYKGDPLRGTASDCQLCACPFAENGRNFATTCAVFPTGELKCFCLLGHVGDKCDRCAEGFYGDPSQLGGYCGKCECNFNSDPNSVGPECDPLFGGCLKCAPGTTGGSCEFCADWYYGDSIRLKNCNPCSCDQCGSEYCDKNDGSCECKDGVVGSRCDKCAPTYWGFDRCTGCDACDCSFASYTSQCNANTGQCDCKPGVDGLKCDVCAFGHWNWSPAGCQRCECDSHLRCDMMTGACICPAGATGKHCDQCADRYVLTLDGCQPCDECVHELLDVMDDLSDQMEGATVNITEISVGYLAFQRLNRLNESIQALQPQLVLMQVNNLALSVNISAVNATFDDVTALANEVETKSIGTLGNADGTSQMAEVTKVRAEDLEAKLNSTRDAIRDAISALYNSTESSGNITADAISKLVEQARLIISEIAGRNFSTNKEMAETELGLAKELLERALMLRNTSAFILERAQNVSMNVNDFLDKLGDLLNLSAVANNMSDTANEIMMRNTPPSFEGVLTLVQGNFSAGSDEVDSASALLDEAQKLLNAAHGALEGSQLNASKLEAAVALLEPRIPILQMQGADLTPLVDMAKNYAGNLSKQAEYLDSLLRDTRELAANAVKAANAYKDIADAINAAEAAAKAALNSSSSAEQEAGSFGDRPVQSLKRSKRLGRKAVKALDGIKDLDATLGDVKDSIDKVKADLDDADSTVTNIRNGIDGIPGDSSKCTITVCEGGAADECKPGFTGEECDAALLGQQAQQAVDTAMEADGSAQRAQYIADWVNARLPDLEEKAATLPDVVREANNALVVADDAIDRARGHIDTFRDLDMSLTTKHKNLANLTATMNYNLKELREKINQARTSAAGVKVAMKFGTDSYLQLRRPDNYEVPSTRNVIELYFNTRMDDALLYFAGGPLKTDNYMAIEIKESKPVLRYNLGGEDGEAVVEEDVSDGQWHKVVAERNANTGRVIIFSEGRETPGGASLDSGSTLNFSPEAKFYLGGVPPEVKLPDSITAFSFEGCIDELVYDSESVGLWNFESGEVVNEGCLRNVTVLGTPPEEGWYFDGSGYAIMSGQGTPGSSAPATVLGLYFKTFSQNGLLYLSESKMGVDYLSLELRGGKLYYHWDLGRGPGIVETDNLYNDGEWTRVQITRSNQLGTLLVFKGSVQVESKTGESPAGAEGLEYGQRTFFGGLTGIADGDYPDVTRHGFRGCIRDIKFGSATIDLTDNIGTIGTSPKCVATSITKIAFGGDGGYMSWTPVDIDKSKKIVFQFRTDQPEGLILYTANELGNNYIAVAIVGGAVHCVADSGNDRIEIRSINSNYNDGQPHTCTISKNIRTLTLTVDDTQDNPDISTGQFGKKSLRTDYLLYMGGLPEGANVQLGVLPTIAPFIGCIIDLSFDGQLLSMISNVREERNAFTNTCPMSATEAPFTNTTIPPTSPPVEFFSTTPMPMDTCALPEDPAETEVDPADESAFQFGITFNSRFEYATLPQEFRRSGKLSLDIRTSAVNGMLFYVSDQRQIDREFAFLKEGKIVFGFDYGSGPVLITSDKKINDGEWHNVVLNRVRTTGIIEVDDVEVAKQELRGDSIYLRTTTPLYVGGIPNDYTPKGVEEGSSGSLLGCIKNLALNDRMQGVPDADKQYDVKPCSGIKEPGVFFGPGSGHVVLDPEFNVGANLEVRMSLKPRSSTGIIFSVTATPRGDFMSLEMVDGVLYLRCDNGGGEIEATYTPGEGAYFMCNGHWHDIVAIKEEHTLQLIVDGEMGLIATGTDRAQAANTNVPLYLGGLPAGEEHRGLRTDQDYVGCIRDVMFRFDLIDFKMVDSVVGDVDLQACPAR